MADPTIIKYSKYYIYKPYFNFIKDTFKEAFKAVPIILVKGISSLYITSISVYFFRSLNMI